MNGKFFIAVIAVILTLVSCNKPTGNICLNFGFTVDGNPLISDTCIYSNAADNSFEIEEVQFFISQVSLLDNENNEFQISDNKGIRYVDFNNLNTLKWLVSDDVPVGKYEKLKFVFGLCGLDNDISNFPNPPENNMSWPDVLGGGLHYMKIDGKWLNDSGLYSPFNIHLGKILSEDGTFRDNTLTVICDLKNCIVSKNTTSDIKLNMEINNWFTDPYIFDFNQFGGSIMQNYDAQILLCSNGYNVFSVEN